MAAASPKRRTKRAVPPANDKPVRRVPLEALGILILIGAAVWSYWPSLTGQWLMNWDDNFMAVDNTKLRSLSGLWKIWVAAPGDDYWPLTSTLLWIEWHLFGPQPLGYHLCNLALHIGSALLIWRLLAKLGLSWGWLGGLLFAVHPLTVESIAWVSEVKNAWSLPLFLWAILSYIRFDEKGERSSYVCALLFYIAAMLSKTSVVMLPLVLLLYCWWKRNAITSRDLIRVAPFCFIALVLGCVTIAMQAPTPISELPAARTPWQTWLTAGQIIFFYIGNFLWPTKLVVLYPQWTLDHPSALQLAPWPLLMTLLALLYLNKSWGRQALLGFGFYIIMLLPVLGFVHFTYMKFSWVADHFAYLPMIGLIGLVVAGCEYLHGHIPGLFRRVLIVVLTAMVVALSLETRLDAGEFTDEKTLWTATLERNPSAAPADTNLGLIFLNSGQAGQAIPLFQKALALQPRFMEARCNLATAFVTVGDRSEAIAQLREAEAINPNYAISYYDLGTIYLRAGQLPDAIAQLQKAVELRPHYVDAEDNLGYALRQSGQPQAAVPLLRAALEDHPNDVYVHFNLGAALMDLKQYPEAVDEFEIVIRLAPGMAQAQAMLARAQSLAAASNPAR